MTKGGKAKRQGYSIADILFPSTPKAKSSSNRNSKKIQGAKQHHDSLKGGQGNNSNRRSRGGR
ncbi:hypothetical protein [Mycobacterium sp. E2989]|uniref:hypothetical protein n=1 Tax=Mycobacterium sp. E2989 TaxID=1834140 RepID=UPI0012E6FD2B|nr:hypothetical protein [Mycobacterium sp. E2989]